MPLNSMWSSSFFGEVAARKMIRVLPSGPLVIPSVQRGLPLPQGPSPLDMGPQEHPQDMDLRVVPHGADQPRQD